MNTRPLVLLLALAACGGTPPNMQQPNALALHAPEKVKAAPGAAAFFDVTLDNGDGATLTAAGLVPAVISGTRVELDVPRGTAAGAVQLTLTATKGDQKAEATVEVDVLPPFQSPTQAPSVSIRLDSLFYVSGQMAKVTVDFGTAAVPSPLPDVVLVSSESRDVEKLTLTPVSAGVYTSSAVAVTATDAAAATLDGTLTLPQGGMFFALLPLDSATYGASMLSDFAWVDGERAGTPKSRVEPKLMLTADEQVVPEGGRAVGTLLRVGHEKGDGMPIQLATEELIVLHADDAELQRFLAASNGQLLTTQDVDGSKPHASLVQVDPKQISPARLALMRGLLEDSAELVTSKSDVQGIYGLALALRLEGFAVAVNPRLTYHSSPTVNETTLLPSMMMAGRPGSSCVPGDSAMRCATDAPALWAYLDLLELDRARVKVAVLDMGFAPNADFRTNADGSIDQCDMTGRHIRCGAGAALGVPTVGASLVGPREWHGTGVVTTLGGIIDNGFGGAGTGGQVAVPMLYKYDLAAYAFDMGAGMQHAVDHGAQVINISAGYPCTAVMRVGPDFDFCSVEGRVGICAIVTAATQAAAIAFCLSPAAAIPIGGAIACGVLEGAAIAATSACVATLALGNVRAPMQSAVAHATSRGVPVVNSAGNRMPPESLPDPIRSLVDLSDARTEDWGMVPATIPNVIVVGAAGGADLGNIEFFGDRVDVWAPIASRFTAPSSPDDAMSMLVDQELNGTSGAAPYVAGVVAAMQAANPSLDPARCAPADCATAVERLRGMLVTSALTNAQLVTLGWKNDPVERRNLVDPLKAVLAAGAGVQPDLAALGYDTHLNFDEAASPDDTAAQARPMPFDTTVTGTVVSFDSQANDEDWKTFTVPSAAGRVLDTTVTVRWLGDEEPVLRTAPGDAAFPHVSSVLTGVEKSSTYHVVRASGAVVPFAVTSRGTDDAVYKVTVATPMPMAPYVTITSPVVVPGMTMCANQAVTFRAAGTYADSALTVPTVEWLIDGVTQTQTSLTATFTRPPGTDTFTARAFGSASSVTITFVACTATAQITSPSANVMQYAMNGDVTGPYLTLNFTGRALDAMGAVIDPATLVFEWSTNRGELQPGAPASGTQLLGTGASLTNVNIYGAPGQVAETHIITLTVRAFAGGPALSTANITVTVQNLI